MKRFGLLAIALSITALTTACSVKSSGDNSDSPGVQSQEKNWPAYAANSLAGQVFGADWKAVTAVARPSQSDANKMVVSIFNESVPAACGSQISNKPYATVILPKAYKAQEYVTDLEQGGEGDPLVFTKVGTTTDVLVALRTKVKIQTITDAGFDALIYARAEDENGAVSEINGTVSVIDCSKNVDFNVWTSLAGGYSLKSYDGVAQDSRYTNIEIDNSRFYDRKSSKYVSAVMFPLYYSVSAGSDASYNFGPIEGLGTSQVTDINGVKTLSYSYHGPVNYRGMDITMNLDMKVIESGRNMDVTYTLEVPNQVTKVTHQFTLAK